MKDTEDLTGKQLGPYQVVTPLGKGGMGMVYKAYEVSLARYVALKVLPRRYTIDPVFVGRFWQEAMAAANLEHPHILPIYAYGEHEGYHYIAMQLVREGSLAGLLHGQPLQLEQIRHIITQVGAALDFAHSRNVIHRDVKPDNILISRRSGCLLADFGIAKLLESTAHHTQTGASVGTPLYMSPEQIVGQEEPDGRSDIYSLGVVLYEMCIGRPPFQGTVQAIQMKHLYEAPPSPQKLNPELPAAVVNVILKALAKKREERYPTAAVMLQALQAAIPTGRPAEAEAGALILGTPPGVVALEDQEAEESKPIAKEELTAVLTAATAAGAAGERRPEASESEAASGSADAPVAQPGAKAPTQVNGPRSAAGLLLRIPAVGWIVVLALAAVVVGTVLWWGGGARRALSTPMPPTLIAGGAGTEVPTPVPTALPSPTYTSAPAATPTATTPPAPSDTPAPSPTPAPTDTPLPSLTPAPTDTATPEPTPTQAPTAALPPAPDLGGWLAIPLMYGNEPKVYIVSTGGELQAILGAARQPDYTRDGSRLIVNGDWGAWDKLRVSGPIGQAPLEIGDPALAGHSHPSWSPNADQVIYDDGSIDPTGWRIYIRDLQTNGPDTGPGTLLKTGVGRGELVGRYPLWTTQDRYIFNACNTWEIGQESDCGIWVMQGNQGTPQKLTASPDHFPIDVRGDTLVYVSAEKGNWDVYSLDIVSGAAQPLTTDGAADGAPAIAPDGRSVAFLSDRAGRLAVWYVSIRGGPAQKFFDIPTDQWGQLRADGWSEEKLAWGAP